MTIQIPVLDDRNFEQLVTEAKARIPVHTPEWTNLNASDPGITILELFAFLTDNLLYRSNRIPEANRIKFLTMLGVTLQPASPGIGLVTFSNDRGPLHPPLALLDGTQVTAGQVQFLTTTPLPVLPVSSACYYKSPQTLDAATQAQYQLLYQTFLQSSSDVLSFYQPVALPAPSSGKRDPVVDLGDPINGTIDRSLWVALLAPPNADLDAVRQAIAGQTLTIGVYPATAVAGQVLAPMTVGGPSVDPGLVFEIAAPESDPTGLSGLGYGIGPANYTRLPVTYADPVLHQPGIVQVTLPPYNQILLWNLDPEEDGTGDYPPRVDDAAVLARLVTWIRVRYPPLPTTGAAGTGSGSITTSTTGAGSTTALAGSSGCGCGQGGPSATGLWNSAQSSGATMIGTADSVTSGEGTAAAPAITAQVSVGSGGSTGSQPCGCSGCASIVQSSVPTTSALASQLASDAPTGRLTWVAVNAANVIQAVPVTAEALGTGTGTPFQTFTVANTPVIVDPNGAGLLLEVQGPDGNWQAWQVIDDIYAAAPSDTRYTLDPAAGLITCGSGLFGSRFPLSAAVRATYRYGGGLPGQVPIGAIVKSPTLPGGFSVSNPVATWGASDAESASDGEADITRWLRTRDRLVTVQDFADITRQTPGVDLGRVEVIPLFNPDQPDPTTTWPGMVTVLVIPRSDPLTPLFPSPDLQFLNAVCAWLDSRRLVTTEVHARGPLYRQIWVSVGVEVLPGQVPSIVTQAVKTAVQTFLSPLAGGLPGTDAATGIIGSTSPTGGTGWPLGTDVRGQDIEAVATRVPGVRYVDSVLMAAVDSTGTVIGSVDPVPISGLQLPAATVFANVGPADPTALIGGSQPILPTQVPVPLVPPTC
jgi:hypothetical protein